MAFISSSPISPSRLSCAIPPTLEVMSKSDNATCKGPTESTVHAGEHALKGQGGIPTSDKDNAPTINDVESLGKGVIKTSKNKEQAPYTIVLVGESGVGKSSLLELIANVLAGNGIDHSDLNILDPTNEQGGSNNESKTNSTRIYEFTSKNGIVVRIVDTPGFTSTHCLPQDKHQKKSIETQIKKHTNSATAVLVLANGTVPGVTVGTSHILSALFAAFRKAPTNVAFVLTNVSSPLYENFSTDALNHAPRFLLNNPVALQRRHLELKDDPIMRKGRTDPREAVLAEELNALGMLVELFDWVDGLEQRPTTKYDALQAITAVVDHVAPRRTKNYTTMFALLTGGTQVGSALAIGCGLEARNQPQSATELVRSHWEGSEGQKLLRKAEEKMQEGVSRAMHVFSVE